MKLQDLVLWQRDWFDVGSEEAMRKREALFRAEKRAGKRRIADQLNKVRTGWFDYVEKYAYGLQDALDWDPSVGSTPSVLRLLDIAREASQSDEPDARVWFECMFLIDQAFAQSQIEKDDPMRVLGADLDRFIQLLSGELFEGPHYRETIYSYHDPDRHYMVAEDGIGIGKPLICPGCIERLNRLRCRPLRGGGEPVHLHHRPKNEFWTWLKALKQHAKGRKRPFRVFDRAGLRFIAPDVATVHHLVHMITDLVDRSGGHVVSELESNLMFDITDEASRDEEGDLRVDSPADELNEESSKDFKVAKFDVDWRGRVFEIQLLTYADHYSGLRAISDVGHPIYKLKQGYKYHLPLRFPQPIYGFNWASADVRATLRKWKQHQLGWAVNHVYG